MSCYLEMDYPRMDQILARENYAYNAAAARIQSRIHSMETSLGVMDHALGMGQFLFGANNIFQHSDVIGETMGLNNIDYRNTVNTDLVSYLFSIFNFFLNNYYGS